LKKALIIGVGGQDGSYLAHFLFGKGYEVHGTSRDHLVSPLANLDRLGIRENVRLHSLSLADFRSVLSVLRRVNPDEIYSLAGQTSVGLSFEYPVETMESITVGTLNILECLRLLEHPAKFYHAGSSECYGNTPEPATEETPFRPRSPYAVAKVAAHHAVANYREAYGLFACSGILFNHESPLRPGRFVTQKIVSAARRISAGSGEKLPLGNLTIQRDWGWAPEYVVAMWKMLQQPKPQDFVVATGSSHSLEDFTRLVFEACKLRWQDYVVRDPESLRPTDLVVSRACPAKARQELGWSAQTALPKLVEKLIGKEII
jgi:GDPmannose 4,6-dehydratase